MGNNLGQPRCCPRILYLIDAKKQDGKAIWCGLGFWVSKNSPQKFDRGERVMDFLLPITLDYR
jgi:hypothetical protein